MKQLSVAIFLFISALLGTAGAQTLEISPTSVLVDESAVITARGLQPNEHVLIRSELVDGASHHWMSQAEFVADANGTVDLSKQAPVKGSYKNTSAMGLVWRVAQVSRPLRDLGIIVFTHAAGG